MPQLDKVTLFSQVFWLLFLYFFFFLVYLKYFLPTLSKLFKVRAYYLTNENSVASSVKIVDLSHLASLLTSVDKNFNMNLARLQKYYLSELNFFNSNFFKKINKLFIAVYIKNCLKSNLYKKLYFK